MKKILRNTIFNAFALFLTSLALQGVKITGGVWSFVIAGFVLSLLFFILRPIFTALTFPLRFLTFGAIAVLINALILYILIVIYPNMKISEFTFQGASFAGFIVPKVHLNAFFAFLAASLLISGIMSILSWITEK